MEYKLTLGRIVYSKVALPDPQGVNPKGRRKYIVVATPTEIKEDESIWIVGITSQIRGLPEEVELPFGRNCRNSCTKRSVALCTWKHYVRKNSLETTHYFVDPPQLLEIFKKARL